MGWFQDRLAELEHMQEAYACLSEKRSRLRSLDPSSDTAAAIDNSLPVILHTMLEGSARLVSEVSRCAGVENALVAWEGLAVAAAGSSEQVELDALVLSQHAQAVERTTKGLALGRTSEALVVAGDKKLLVIFFGSLVLGITVPASLSLASVLGGNR